MRYYSENFKKAVVKKILIPGLTKKEVCKKINISESSVSKWIKQYRHEVEPEVMSMLVDTIEPEPEEEVDIDKLLLDYDRNGISNDRRKFEENIDKILSKGKNPTEYNFGEKYLIVAKIRNLKNEEKGMFYRRSGIHSDHIKLWEDEILKMGKKQIDKDAYIKKLEEENKKLKKSVKGLERDKTELKILIELKKKYKNLFADHEED